MDLQEMRCSFYNRSPICYACLDLWLIGLRSTTIYLKGSDISEPFSLQYFEICGKIIYNYGKEE